MPDRPFTTFNFHVNLTIAGEQQSVCAAEFSECEGLEITMESKTIREGGNNARQIHLAGPVSYGQLTLKRGMTRTMDLWQWFEKVQQNRSLRAAGTIQMKSSDRTGTDVTYTLTGCLPVKLKAPGLNAKDGGIAIEELGVAYETLAVRAGG